MRFRTLIYRLHPMDFNFNQLHTQPYKPQPFDFNFTSLFNGSLPFTPIGRSDFINDPALFSRSAFDSLFPNFINSLQPNLVSPSIQYSGLERMPTIIDNIQSNYQPKLQLSHPAFRKGFLGRFIRLPHNNGENVRRFPSFGRFKFNHNNYSAFDTPVKNFPIKVNFHI